MILETESGSIYEVDTHNKRVRLLGTFGPHKPAPHRHEWAPFQDFHARVGYRGVFFLVSGAMMRTTRIVDVRGYGLPVGLA